MLSAARNDWDWPIVNVIEKIEAVAKFLLEDAVEDADCEAMIPVIMSVHQVWFGEGAISIVEALVQTKLAGSKREARELLAGGAIRENGRKITDSLQIYEPGRCVVLRRGKRLAEVIYVRFPEEDGVS